MEAKELFAPGLEVVIIRGSDAGPHTAAESPGVRGDVVRQERRTEGSAIFGGGSGMVRFTRASFEIARFEMVSQREGLSPSQDNRADQRPRIVKWHHVRRCGCNGGGKGNERNERFRKVKLEERISQHLTDP